MKDRRAVMGIVSALLVIAWMIPHGSAVFAQQPVPQDVAQRLAPDCPGRYNGGPTQLTPQQPTRIEVVCRVTNPLNEAVDYSATMVFVLGERTSVVGGSAQRGQLDVVGNEIRWSGFALNPGESATATAVVDVTPVPGDGGRTLNVFTTTRTTARTASGGFVSIEVGPLSTTTLTGLRSGGFVLQPGAAPPAGAGAGTTPRTGGGPGDEVPRWSTVVGGVLASLATAFVVAVGIAGLSRRRSRA